MWLGVGYDDSGADETQIKSLAKWLSPVNIANENVLPDIRSLSRDHISQQTEKRLISSYLQFIHGEQ